MSRSVRHSHNANRVQKGTEKFFHQRGQELSNAVADVVEKEFATLRKKSPVRRGVYRAGHKISFVVPTETEGEFQGLSKKALDRAKYQKGAELYAQSTRISKATLYKVRNRKMGEDVDFYISNNVFYGKFLEYGTKNMKPMNIYRNSRRRLTRNLGKAGKL